MLPKAGSRTCRSDAKTCVAVVYDTSIYKSVCMYLYITEILRMMSFFGCLP